MRTLKQITDSVRRNEGATTDELVATVVAYDVLLAKLNIERDDQQLKEFFLAAESDPQLYHGWINDPNNPEVEQWHREREQVGEIVKVAKQQLADEGQL